MKHKRGAAGAPTAHEGAEEGRSSPEASDEAIHSDPGGIEAAVCKQIEFYFSDANLPTDKHLLQQITRDPEGYVSLQALAGFNRVKALTRDVSVVAKALRSSSALMLDEAGMRVRRVEPLPPVDAADITRRIVLVEHLPPSPTVDGVKQLMAQYGEVTMVRICGRGGSGKLPGWLGGIVKDAEKAMGVSQFALVEFAGEDGAIAAVASTRNADNWRTSLRVRHLLAGYKPSRAVVAAASGKSKKKAGGSGPAPGMHGVADDASAAAAAVAMSAIGRQVGGQPGMGLSPIRTTPAVSGDAAGAALGSPTSVGAPGSPAARARALGGIGGAIGSPRTQRSPAPAEVSNFIDSILSAPTAGTPTRDGRGGSSSADGARWSSTGGGSGGGGGGGGGGGTPASPAAAVAAALAGVCTPPQAGSPRACGAGGGTRGVGTGGTPAAVAAPTRLAVVSSAAQGALAAQLATAAAAAATAAISSSPRGSGGRSAPGGTPITGLAVSAGDAVGAALDEWGAGSNAAAGGALPSGSPGRWVPPSRLLPHDDRGPRASWGGEAASPSSHPRGSSSGGGRGRARRRSWHQTDGDDSAAHTNSGMPRTDGNSSDGAGHGGGARRSRLSHAQQQRQQRQQQLDAAVQDVFDSVRMEAEEEAAAAVAAMSLSGGVRRPHSNTGHERAHPHSTTQAGAIAIPSPRRSQRSSHGRSPSPEPGTHGSVRPRSTAGSPAPPGAAGLLAGSEARGEGATQAAGTGKDAKKRGGRKDYASWAAATPEFRAVAAAARHPNCGTSSPSVLGTSPSHGIAHVGVGDGGGAAVAVAHNDAHGRISRGPDGTRGFGMGRGRPLTPPSLS